MATRAEGEPARVKLWDWSVRLVHWAFVLLLPALWWTAEEGDLALHKQLGMGMLVLIVFRLLWGLVGSSTARFAGFLRGPAAVGRYIGSLLRGKADEPVVGHNPIGGWSVMIMLALLAWQVGLGLIAQDTDGLESGPLNYLVDYDTAEWAREMHELGFNLILAVVGLHVLAIVYYLTIRRDNLIGPMFSGRKRLQAGLEAPRIAPWWLALICLAIAVGVAWYIWPWWFLDQGDSYY